MEKIKLHIIISAIMCMTFVSCVSESGEEYHKFARIGNIEVGMDSVLATRYLVDRLNSIPRVTERPYIVNGDSVGYTISNCESFYLKFVNKKVSEIIFESQVLSDKEIVMFDKNERVQNDTDFIKVTKDFTIEKHGNKFTIKSNKNGK